MYVATIKMPEGVATVPWFFTMLVKTLVAVEYVSEVGTRSGRDEPMEIIGATAGTPDELIAKSI
jgi:hypothetical protein